MTLFPCLPTINW